MNLLILFVLAISARGILCNVQCDDTHECVDGQTCCKLQSGEWGCCPIPQAVCCDDHVHCCPNGYTCDTSSGRCTKGDLILPWLPKTPALTRKVEAVQCDSTHECQDGQTCCQLQSGEWGCCPLPQAVCCDDKVHCCPNGYTCQTGSGRCSKGPLMLPMVEKVAAKESVPEPLKAVQCDSTHECQDGQTCCQLQSGEWGCCPLPQAVCCDDKVHCCPNGYTCQTGSGRCTKGDEVLSWLSKQPATKKKVEAVQCDSTHECQDGQTCCQLQSGEWGCCPLPQAVCCDDKVHCCPNGYTCQTGSGRCTKQNHSMPWMKKPAATLVKSNKLH